MKMRKEDLFQLGQSDVAAQELALRPLCAIEEKAVASSSDERGGKGTLSRRSGTGRPEENDVEIHGGRFYALK